ncbi:helix-turn-helix transcriptional regulator [Amycolatopsis sacchari]|uniref:helix-turn-helix transcriptional regulator n=1 Tax=Amycolatopsis sacchari TaxID=115433 RepID=UPI003D73159B
MTKKLLTIDDLSDYLGIPKGTLYQWRTKGYGPAGIRVGKYVRYRPDDVDAWLDGQEAA